MILNDHVTDYIASLDPDEPEALARLEQWALENSVPIIRHDAQRFLRFLLMDKKPKAILEIGAAVGFSTLYMHEYAPLDAEITTIEKVEMRLVHTRKNLAGHDRIHLIEGDATDVLHGLATGELRPDGTREGVAAGIPAQFDFVFLDAAKGQYLAWLPDILKLMPKGAMFVTDNVLLEGTIAESKFSIERRDRTIHMRMRDYLYELTHNESLETVVLPIGDGMAVSVKK